MPATKPTDAATTRSLRQRITLLGAAVTVCYGVYAALSYGLTPVVKYGEPQPREGAMFAQLAESLAALGPAVQAFVRGDTLADRRVTFLILYVAPVVLVSIAFVLLLALLARRRDELRADAATQITVWSTVFAAVLALAAPILVQDFWLSAAWGRMIAQGINPYYVLFDDAIAHRLALDYEPTLMTYGPAWAVLAGAVMWVAGYSPLLTAVLFKLLLAGAWIGVLWLVRALVRDRTPWEQCVSVAIVGWIPLGVMQAAGDGHNDVVMLLMMLLWLRWRELRRPVAASLALAASVLAKYLSAPLFALDLLHHVRYERRPLLSYMAPALAAAALAVVLFAPFVRSLEFFNAAASMSGWHFYTPRDAVVAAFRMIGVQPSLDSLAGVVAAVLAVGTQLAVASLALFGFVRYWRDPGPHNFRYAFAAMTAGILFGVIGHVWPWFMVWAIAAAALVPATLLGRWIVGVALAMPFPLLAWLTYEAPTTFGAPTLLAYLFSLLWLRLAPRRWFAATAADPRALDDPRT